MLILFPTIKKIYPYYLKKLFNWTFWLATGVGLLWIFLRAILFYKIGEIVEEGKKKIHLSPKEQKLLAGLEGFVASLSTNFQEKEFTIEHIFNQSLLFFLMWVTSYGTTLVMEPVIRSLLAVNRPANSYNYWKKGTTRTGEDELILLHTIPIRRREMALSKMLAFITRYLIISFLFSTLPYLINPYNLRFNNLTLWFKFLFFDGLLFPLIFSFFFSFYFWFIELSSIASTFFVCFTNYLFPRSVIKGVVKEQRNVLPALKWTKNNFFSECGVGLRVQSLLVIFFLLWGFFFGWLHIQDFEEIQFS
jgi:hypothetical protein